jgi:TnpA family transposase
MGRLFLTLFLCDFVSNETFRRELLRILDRGEATHRLLRAIHDGNIAATRVAGVKNSWPYRVP